MLTVENLSYSIKGKTLLESINVQFNAGEIAVILGANGAGKTTLTRLLTGELQPTTGKIVIDNKPLHQFDLQEMAKWRAVLSQSNEVIFPLTVHEVVMMGRYPHFQFKPSKIDIELCNEAMDLFDVTRFQDRNFLSLSGGEKQRVHFARVTAQILSKSTGDLKLLFLDEPLTFLDIRFQISFMDTIKTLTKSKNILVVGVLHDLNLALKYADQIVLLKDGKRIANGKAKGILTAENIELAFGVKPEIIVHSEEEIRLFF